MTDSRQDRLRERMAELDAVRENAQQPPLPVRRQVSRFLSTALFFFGMVVVALRCISIWRDYNGWRNAGNDQSAREAYITFIEFDTFLLVVTLAAFMGAAALLRWWAYRES